MQGFINTEVPKLSLLVGFLCQVWWKRVFNSKWWN